MIAIIAVLAGLLLPAGHATADPVAGTGLNRLAAAISQAPVEVRADFAAVALGVLVAFMWVTASGGGPA